MKKILNTQLEYIVHKSNLDRAQKELARLKRTGASEEEIAKAKTRVEYLRAKSKVANEAIDTAGVSKTVIGK
jgi:ABC-type taurine transport system substrate-binding protein